MLKKLVPMILMQSLLLVQYIAINSSAQFKFFLRTYQNILENKLFAVFVTMVEYGTFNKVIAKEIAGPLRKMQ